MDTQTLPKSIETPGAFSPPKETIQFLTEPAPPPVKPETPSEFQQPTQAPDETTPSKKGGIVDKSDEPVTLHQLKTRETLTTIADREEEEFIKEVEKHHPHESS